jgi:AcrR family transcriptional regulator
MDPMLRRAPARKEARITGESSAPRSPNRRRGAAIEQAIYTAVLSELAEAGYAGFSLDRVARRARIGRMSI